MACAICGTRKEKRFCPAVHGRICTVCCGTEREVTLDCPADCAYLQQARRNIPPRDLATAAATYDLDFGISQSVVHRHVGLFDLFLSTLVRVRQRHRPLYDRDVLNALVALTKQYEIRANSGLLYRPAAANPLQQEIVTAFEQTVAGYREQTLAEYAHVRDSEVRQVIIAVLQLVLLEWSGRPRSRGFLDYLEQEIGKDESRRLKPEESESRLILP